MSYTVPTGTTLGEILSIQHNDAAGIETSRNPDGTYEIRNWPVGLGALPTQQNVTDWARSQAASKPDRLAASEYAAAKMMRATMAALKIQFPSLDLAKLATDARAIYKTL